MGTVACSGIVYQGVRIGAWRVQSYMINMKNVKLIDQNTISELINYAVIVYGYE